MPVRHITAGRNADVRHVDGVPFGRRVPSDDGRVDACIPSTQADGALDCYYPSVHGASHVRDLSAIGIDDIMHPDYGDALR